MNNPASVILSLNEIIIFQQLREIDKQSEPILELAASIREIGLQQPLTVRHVDGNYILIDGERRYFACQLAAMTSVPVIVENKELSESEIIRRQWIPNCQRQDLTPMEKARAIDRLMKCSGWTAGETAQRLGVSPASVTRLLALLTLPPTVVSQVESGELSASAAYEISKVMDPVQQQNLVARAVGGKLTRDQLAGSIKATQRAAALTTEKKSARLTAHLPLGRSVTLNGCDASLEAVIATLKELLARLKNEQGKGRSLSTTLRILAEESRKMVPPAVAAGVSDGDK